MVLKVDREAIEFIREKGGKVWVRSVCIHGCCGVEGFEPQFSFKQLEENGNWKEYEYEGVKIYVHEGLSQHKKLVITLQKVFGFKSLMGYLV